MLLDTYNITKHFREESVFQQILWFIHQFCLSNKLLVLLHRHRIQSFQNAIILIVFIASKCYIVVTISSKHHLEYPRIASFHVDTTIILNEISFIILKCLLKENNKYHTSMTNWVKISQLHHYPYRHRWQSVYKRGRDGNFIIRRHTNRATNRPIPIVHSLSCRTSIFIFVLLCIFADIKLQQHIKRIQE